MGIKESNCIDCNKPIRKYYTRCKTCENKRRIGKNSPMFGYKHTNQAKLRISINKLGEKNPNWKGNKVGYTALHDWVKSRLSKPKLCQNCNINEAYDLANTSGKYHRNLNDWTWLCRKCHMKSDGRLNNLKQYGRKIIV